MPFTRGSQVEFHWLNGGYSESWGRDGVTIRTPVILSFDDKEDFASDMVGWSVIGAGGILSRSLPEPHPAYTPQAYTAAGGIYAIAVEFTDTAGYASETGLNDYVRYVDASTGDDEDGGMIIGTVTWEGLPYAVLSDGAVYGSTTIAAPVGGELLRFVSRSKSLAIENLNWPAGFFIWKNAPHDPIPTGIPLLLGSKQHTYTWTQVPADANGLFPAGLETNITNTVGRLNASSFDPVGVAGGGGRFAAGTLMCLCPNIVQGFMPSGSIGFTIGYILLEKPQSGWNNFLRPSTGTWDPIVQKSDSTTPPFASADFNKLFQLT
jgi:hypothetical protein